MKLFAAVNVVSIFLASSTEVHAADLRGARKGAASVNVETIRDLLESTFSGKLKNGLDNSLCLTYNYDNEKLQVQTCDGNGFPEEQHWDLFNSYGAPHLHPGGDICLKAMGDGSSKYDSLTMTGQMWTCTEFQTTSEGKIYTEYDDGTKMYLGISKSCHTEDVEGRKVELQRFNFSTDRTCGKAQLWYIE